uniref:Uncharacterized protein n=1 Tax=Glossina austeni TaxID=7395 RepID=A0A1A9VLC3_GLOAU
MFTVYWTKDNRYGARIRISLPYEEEVPEEIPSRSHAFRERDSRKRTCNREHNNTSERDYKENLEHALKEKFSTVKDKITANILIFLNLSSHNILLLFGYIGSILPISITATTSH